MAMLQIIPTGVILVKLILMMRSLPVSCRMLQWYLYIQYKLFLMARGIYQQRKAKHTKDAAALAEPWEVIDTTHGSIFHHVV